MFKSQGINRITVVLLCSFTRNCHYIVNKEVRVAMCAPIQKCAGCLKRTQLWLAAEDDHSWDWESSTYMLNAQHLKKQSLAEMMINKHVFRAHKRRKFDGLVFCRAQFLLITIFIMKFKYSDIVWCINNFKQNIHLNW